jgi:hypothetical protein
MMRRKTSVWGLMVMILLLLLLRSLLYDLIHPPTPFPSPRPPQAAQREEEVLALGAYEAALGQGQGDQELFLGATDLPSAFPGSYKELIGQVQEWLGCVEMRNTKGNDDTGGTTSDLSNDRHMRGQRGGRGD